MTLQLRLQDFITAVATDYKQLRTWMTGSAAGDLTGLNTANKASLVDAINEIKATGGGGGTGTTVSAATELDAGIAEIATQAETTLGTDDNRFVTPLKLAQKLSAWAQPLNANLTALAGVVSGSFGRTLLGAADSTTAKNALGLAAVASSGSASDITTGTLPTSVMPPLAINDTFTVASQAAMLALTAQRGDVAIRTDIGRSYILASDSPTTLADWKQLTAGGDVASVAGRTGAVVLAKADVGLANVDNTSDASKPVSTAQATAIALKADKSSNLSDLADLAAARTNLSVYSKTELGNPETDLVAAYSAAKA